MSSGSRLVPIRSFTFSHEANAMRGMLESHGIQVFLRNEFVSNMDVFHGAASGGVKLVVRESDLEEALRLIADVEGTTLDVACPNCGSDQVHVFEPGPLSFRHGARSFFSSLGSVLVALFGMFWFPYRSQKFDCMNCGERFTSST